MKLEKLNEIRRKLRIETNDKTYFNKKEVEKIVSKINPEFKFDSVPFEKVLSSSIPGWKNQTTIETHPSIENLEIITESLKSKRYNLKRLLKLIDKELIDMSKSVTLKNKLLVIELK